jgi:nucleotide-binding universal stress UspA family protein
MYNRILVPLDGSELAEQVLPGVIELANCTGAEIVLLRVPEYPVYEYLMPVADLNTTMQEQAREQARQYLDRISSDLRATGLHVRTQVVYDGAVYSTILETAKDLKVDLIAMSTHGRSGLARLVMGSVADDIVRHAELPVLLVRPQPVNSGLPVHFSTAYTPLPLN